MDQNIASAKEALERRIGLMRELAGSLERAQAAVLVSDCTELRALTRQQQELCHQWRLLISQFPHNDLYLPRLSHILSSPPRANPKSTEERHKALIMELAEVERRVAHLNRAYGALLRRARRTVDIFCRVLASSGATYNQPVVHGASRNQERG